MPAKASAKLAVSEADNLAEMEAAPSTVQRATRLIRESIVTGRFAPGARIKVADLTSTFGIGSMPIREALRKLEGEGLVEIEANRGATVRRLDRKFVQDIYELRAQIDLFAIRNSIRFMTLAKHRQLDAIRIRGENALAAGDFDLFLQADKDLHLTIFQIAGNREAYRFSESTWDLIAALRARFGYQADRVHEIIEEHRLLVGALGALDSQAAERIAAMHSFAGMEDILARMSDVL